MCQSEAPGCLIPATHMPNLHSIWSSARPVCTQPTYSDTANQQLPGVLLCQYRMETVCGLLFIQTSTWKSLPELQAWWGCLHGSKTFPLSNPSFLFNNLHLIFFNNYLSFSFFTSAFLLGNYRFHKSLKKKPSLVFIVTLYCVLVFYFINFCFHLYYTFFYFVFILLFSF